MTRWPEAADEIVVRDGHLTINLYKLSDGWSARIESAYEGRVFEGRVTEMSDLLAGRPVPGDGDAAQGVVVAPTPVDDASAGDAARGGAAPISIDGASAGDAARTREGSS